MTRAQRVVILVGLLVVAAMGVYPPWSGESHPITLSGAGGDMHVHAYGPLWATWTDVEDWDTRIDGLRLLVQWAVVAAITAALVVVLGGRRRREPSDRES